MSLSMQHLRSIIISGVGKMSKVRRIAKVNSAYIDIVRIALRHNGRIPKEIPAHYVLYEYHLHRALRGHIVNKLGFNPILDKPIKL